MCLSVCLSAACICVEKIINILSTRTYLHTHPNTTVSSRRERHRGRESERVERENHSDEVYNERNRGQEASCKVR